MAIVRRIYSAWGTEVSQNIIETSMGKMRKKLDAQFKTSPHVKVETTLSGKIIVTQPDRTRTEYSKY
jgi:hypothetical protein